jgi:putative intracellular protease/amidase
MTQRILIALTSHAVKGATQEPTGAYLPEIAHPYQVFTQAGFEVDFVSVKGGVVPLDGVKDADAESLAFLEANRTALNTTAASASINPKQYAAIFYAGGHGAMWDFPSDPGFLAAARAIYEQGGVVSAVCHGPAALVNLTLSNGRTLVADKQVSAFTDEEERAVKLDQVVPFLLASKLTERGAKHVAAPNWQAQVVVSERLVTGQNPASARGVAEAVTALLKQ